MTKFKLALFAGVAALSLAVLTTSASAITMKAVYTGFVFDTSDATNIFGKGSAPGALDTLAYTLTFIYDPSTVGSNRTSIPAGHDHADGGSAIGLFVSPVQSATITINNHSESFNPFSLGSLTSDNASNYTEHFGLTSSTNGVSNYVSYLYQYSSYGAVVGNVPGNLETPYQVSLINDGNPNHNYGKFLFTTQDITTSLYSRNTFGSLQANTLTVTRDIHVSPVPLPAALPLFGLGLGALGLVGRARRKKAV